MLIISLMLFGCVTTAQDKAYDLGVASYGIAVDAMTTIMTLRHTCLNATAIKADPTIPCHPVVTDEEYQAATQHYVHWRQEHNNFVHDMQHPQLAKDAHRRAIEINRLALALQDLAVAYGGRQR